jgi:hypothetical protein
MNILEASYILEISNSSIISLLELKKQYRILTKKYHPDINKNPECTNKFKKINEAYQFYIIILNTEQKATSVSVSPPVSNNNKNNNNAPKSVDFKYVDQSFIDEFFHQYENFGLDLSNFNFDTIFPEYDSYYLTLTYEKVALDCRSDYRDRYCYGLNGDIYSYCTSSRSPIFFINGKQVNMSYDSFVKILKRLGGIFEN